MRLSQAHDRGPVPLPAFAPERIYMLPFFLDAWLPDFARRWQPTVDAMTRGLDTPLPVFLMVDAAHVPAGQAHRRPGVHVDGYWQPGWDGVEPLDTWVARTQACMAPGGRGPGAGRHGGHRIGMHSRHGAHPFFLGRHGGQPCTPAEGAATHETLVLATDVAACRVYEGAWDGMAGPGGDCSHLDLRALEPRLLEAGRARAGDTGALLHETVPLSQATARTVVRLNVPMAA